MITPAEVRLSLHRYLKGEWPLEQFEQWFAPVLAVAGRLVDTETEALVQGIEWAFWDFEHGSGSQNILRANLRQLAGDTPVIRQPLVVGDAVYSDMKSGTSSTPQDGPAIVVQGSLRILPEAVYA